MTTNENVNVKNDTNTLVGAVLEEDAKHRVVGVATGLINLSECAIKSWDFSAPTISDGKRSRVYGDFSEITLCPDQETFADLFYKKYPLLKGVPLNKMLIAGGAVGQFIRLRDDSEPCWEAGDLDVFLCGNESVATSQARMVKFLLDIEAGVHKAGREYIKRTLLAEKKKSDESIAKYESAVAKYDSMVVARPSQNIARIAADEIGEARVRSELIARVIGSLPGASFEVAGKVKPSKPRRKVTNDDDDNDDSDDGKSRARDGRQGYMDAGYCQMNQPRDFSKAEWASVRDFCRYQMPSVSAVRTAGSLTVTYHGGFQQLSETKIQVIFRHYAHASEVLHGFDLGSCAVGFDGTDVLLTGLSRFSYEYGLNIVDTTRRSPSYEYRLHKYATRGFAIVMPHLNIAVLRKSPNLKHKIAAVADLPFMPFVFDSIEGNRICMTHFVKQYEIMSDYGPDGEILDDNDDNDYRIAYINLRRLVHGSTDFIYAAKGFSFEDINEVLTKMPHLTIDMVQRLYDTFQGVDGGRRGSAWDGRRLNMTAMAGYCPLADIPELLTRAKTTSMTEQIDAIFSAQRIEAIRLWNKNIRDANHAVIPWITENPGKQGPLTGSRSPIVASPEAWYGAANYLQ